MFITTQFSIKDLESLTGVKAHTIRIWEKRYNLLEPSRTDTNIRKYDLTNLKRLLNVTFLYDHGFKISKIARLNEAEIGEQINELAKTNSDEFARKSFKTAMFDFDQHLFSETYNKLLQKRSFEEIFQEILMPLLYEIGLLWQTGTIDPSHERFISELVKQRIILNISKVQEKRDKREVPAFALYLPYEEIHEIGLLYANYQIIAAGFNTVYLGTNIPISSLKYILKHYDKITFVSYFTVKPDSESIYQYVQRFQEEICTTKKMNLWMMGWKVQGIIPGKLPTNVSVIHNLEDLHQKLKKLKLS